MKKVVITGPPFAGKSAVIKDLEDKGYKVEYETAREVLNVLRNMNFKDPHKERRDLFQKEVLRFQLEKESRKCESSLIFYERGIIDNLAYYHLDKIQPPEELVFLSKIRRYDVVFYFEPIPKEKVGRSILDERERMLLESLIFNSYLDCGYTPIRVPVLSVEDRTNLILREVMK